VFHAAESGGERVNGNAGNSKYIERYDSGEVGDEPIAAIRVRRERRIKAVGAEA